MKEIKEIISRAIILLTISDRCALESSVVEGKIYSKKQREVQRKAINDWLEKYGYTNYMTKAEIYFMGQEAGTSGDAIENQFQYEAIEPLLWSLGLVDNLTSYNQYVLEDFHPILQIGGQHNYEKLFNCCYLKSNEDIYLQKEIAMLWYWRVIEKGNPIFHNNSIKNIIVDIFGQQYEEILLNIQNFDSRQKDFVIGEHRVSDLGELEFQHLWNRAKWRYYAFEWMTGEVNWDDVELNS